MCSDIYRRASCWTEEIIFTTHLRIAAGICVLSTGLLIGSSAAIATADLNDTTGGAAAGSQGTGSADVAADSLTNTDQDAGQGATTMGSTGGDAPTSTVDAQTTVIDNDQEESGAAALDSDESASESLVAPETNAPESEPNVPTSEPNVLASDSSVPASDSTTPAPTATPAAAPVAAPPPTYSTVVVEPVTNAFATVAKALGSGAATFAALPNSETPIADVITSMQEMLSSVAGAGATLAQVSNDLYTLLGVSQDVQTLIGAGGTLTAATPAAEEGAPLFGPLTSQLPLVLPTGVDAPLFGNVVHATTVGGVATSGLSQELSLSGLAPLAPAGVDGGARSFFEHVVNAVLLPASLTALAALALPGAGALLIVCAAGMRVGYRQAKAGLALRASGIARFAGPGPMGVVRSGSLIALHPRASRADRPKPAHALHAKASPAVRHLERVA